MPNTHFLAKQKEGITFKDLDKQSYLVTQDLGLWNKVIEENLSKLFRKDNIARFF